MRAPCPRHPRSTRKPGRRRSPRYQPRTPRFVDPPAQDPPVVDPPASTDPGTVPEEHPTRPDTGSGDTPAQDVPQSGSGNSDVDGNVDGSNESTADSGSDQALTTTPSCPTSTADQKSFVTTTLTVAGGTATGTYSVSANLPANCTIEISLASYQAPSNTYVAAEFINQQLFRPGLGHGRAWRFRRADG